MSWVRTRNDHVRVIVSGHVAVQHTTAEYIVARKRHEERVLQIVIECFAISNALEIGAGGRRHYLCKMRLRGAKSATHIGTEKILQDARPPLIPVSYHAEALTRLHFASRLRPSPLRGRVYGYPPSKLSLCLAQMSPSSLSQHARNEVPAASMNITGFKIRVT